MLLGCQIREAKKHLVSPAGGEGQEAQLIGGFEDFRGTSIHSEPMEVDEYQGSEGTFSVESNMPIDDADTPVGEGHKWWLGVNQQPTNISISSGTMEVSIGSKSVATSSREARASSIFSRRQ